MKKTWIITILIAMGMMLIAGIWSILPIGRLSAEHEYLITKYYRFETITEDGILQYFRPQYNYLDSIELFLANISSETEGKIRIELFDSKGKIVFEKSYKASDIPTGEYKKYKVGKKVKQNDSYLLRISYNGEEEKPQIMVSERRKNLLETEEMYVGEELSDFNMAITYHYSMRTWFGAGY